MLWPPSGRHHFWQMVSVDSILLPRLSFNIIQSRWWSKWRSAKMLLGRSNPSWQWKSNISKLQRASAKVAFGATNKYPVTFQYAGWLTGILTMVYYNPHVVWSPRNPKQPGLTLLNWSIPLRSNAKKSLIQAFVNCSDHRGFVSRHGSCSLDCKMAMMRTRTWLLHAPCCSKNLTSISVVKQ